jgi:hypothetical protein
VSGGHLTRVMCVSAVVALALAACTTEVSGSPPTQSPGEPAEMTTAPDGSGSSTSTTTAPVERPVTPLETISERRTWMTPSGEEWVLELEYPDESVDGGWPVLVTFHGAQLGTGIADLRDLAAEGIVVAAPRWADPAWTFSNLTAMGSAADYAMGLGYETAPCALAAAQAAAADVGGDPTRTTVEGMSAGVHPAATVGLAIEPGSMQREALGLACRDVDVVAPIGLVLGDAQWLFETESFDEAFEMPFSVAREAVDGFIDPARWHPADELVAYLWSTDDWVRENRAIGTATSVDREVAPYPNDSWLTLRSNDWTALGEDLRATGAFDDGIIGFADNGRLQAFRMESTGIPVLYEDVSGVDHDYTPDVLERILDVVWREGFAAGG